MDDCIFCKIVRQEIPCFRVYEDERVLAFADINPVSSGHTLVIPKAHAATLMEMPAEDLTAVLIAAQKIARAMDKAWNPSGIACLQLNGRGANQVVDHYHLHVVPRMQGEEELPMTCWELKPGDKEVIAANAKALIAALEE